MNDLFFEEEDSLNRNKYGHYIACCKYNERTKYPTCICKMIDWSKESYSWKLVFKNILVDELYD